MKLSFDIAVRFLVSNKGQTTLILVGIAIGVSVLIFLSSLIGGLQADLIDTAIGSSSQITIEPTDEDKTITTIKDPEKIILKMRAASDDFTVITPVIDGSGFALYKTEDESVRFRGLDLSDAEAIYGLRESITEGRGYLNDREVIIGTLVAENLGLVVGETITLKTPDDVTYNVEVVGLFDLENLDLNSSWVIGSVPAMQSLLGLGREVTGIESQIQDVFSADVLAEELRAVLANETVTIIDWKERNESLLSGLQGQSSSTLLIQVFVLVSVVLGIASVLAITVVQRSRQIGILKAMGISNRQTSMIFLFQGMLLGLFGAIAGVGLGIGLANLFSTFVVRPDGTPVVNILVDYNQIFQLTIFSALAAMVAAIIPANKSKKLDPIEVIKNG